MTKSVRTLLLVIASICLAFTLSACSGDDDEQATSNDNEGATDDGQQEQVLNLTRKSAIPTMDSSLATDEASFQFLSLSMEVLYRLGEDAEVKEGIAIDHEESDDGMQWTFNLRDDAEWSNGDRSEEHTSELQ